MVHMPRRWEAAEGGAMSEENKALARFRISHVFGLSIENIEVSRPGLEPTALCSDVEPYRMVGE